MAGVAAAAVVSMGLIGLPAMLGRKYDKNLAIGSILASGPLGILIPPSVPMVILGTTANMSIGRLFAGGVMPGIMITIMFIIYIALRCIFQHKLAPALPAEERGTWRQKLISLRSVILPALLITAVLGSIFAGIASPTEAAAVGALGALICAVVYGRFNWQFVKEVSYRSASFTAMIMWITFGAVAFSAVYSGAGVTNFILQTIGGLEVNRWFILVVMEVILLFLGCFLEPASMILICAPIFFPIINAVRFDATWFGILFVMLIMVGYLTPPFGYSIFYLKSVAPPSVSMTDIYRSVTPWIIMMLLAIVLVMVFPQIALWLPNLTKG
jgi:tripartite ATP-independent transporter DctM subunit